MGGSEQFERGRDRQSTEDFQGAESILYDTEMIDILLFIQKSQNVQHQE